jgi:copper(I)-binding protein
MKKILSLFVVVITLSSCGETEMQHAGEKGIKVTSPWLREPPPGSQSAAGYLFIQNFEKKDDRLLGVTSSAAERVEIHEIQDEGGMLRMREMENGLSVPAHDSVTLEPGGYHLMFIEPKRTLVLGDTVPMVLSFEQFGEYKVDFQVKSSVQSNQEKLHMHH